MDVITIELPIKEYTESIIDAVFGYMKNHHIDPMDVRTRRFFINPGSGHACNLQFSLGVRCYHHTQNIVELIKCVDDVKNFKFPVNVLIHK